MIGRADLRFAYRLAREMKRLDVEEMLSEMTASELARWEAFYLLEPWGADIDDHRAGAIASTIANVNRDPKKRSQPYMASDFFPSRLPKPMRPLDDAQVDAVFAKLITVEQ